jgi:5-methylthioadenosine/S-adenosylhomocysteine deaminase
VEHTNTLLVRGGRVLDLAADPHQPREADILIESGIVAAISTPGKPRERSSADRTATTIVDARGKLVIPGLINAHYHSHDVFLKGCFDPSILEFWVLNALPRA